jgi:hypothetical protein
MNQNLKFPRRALLAGAAAAVSTNFLGLASADEPLTLIVHPGTTDTPSLAEVAAVFTTRKQNWSDGSRIVPFNFPPKHAVRVSFDQAVLQMGPDDVARYWIDRRIRGGNPPPKQVPTAALIARLVETLEGSIAYVPQSFVSPQVRVVRHI